MASDWNQETTFSATNTETSVPVVALSIQDKTKLHEKLKYCFKRTINWNKYQSKKINRYTKLIFRLLNWFKFLRINGLFVWLFEDEATQTSYKRYYLLTIEIKTDNVMIDGHIYFDQPVISNLRTFDNIRKNCNTSKIKQLVVCWTIIITKTIISKSKLL